MSNSLNNPERIQHKARLLAGRNREHIQQMIAQREKMEFQGEGVVCPVCKSGFSAFAPVYQWKTSLNNETYRDDKQCVTIHPHARCPGCQSLQRHRLLAWFLNQHIFSHPSPTRILEIAPFLPLAETLQRDPLIEYLAVDLSPQSEKYQHATFPIQQADLCDLPFGNGHFDLILCSHVLEHIENETLALSEIFRVMNSQGTAIIQVPANESLKTTHEDPDIIAPEKREAAFGQWDHVRYYGRDFPDRLIMAGFDVHAFRCREMVEDHQIHQMGLDVYETIYLCTNPLLIESTLPIQHR
jgi:SAM-dependent methyltransferase